MEDGRFKKSKELAVYLPRNDFNCSSYLSRRRGTVVGKLLS